jgi:hypothetical protein
MKRLLPMVVVLALAAASAFAKDQHKITLWHAASIHGTTVAPGRYKVTWSAESGDPTVNFIRGKKSVASASAQWVERHTHYATDQVVLDTLTDGAPKITEIRFAGKSHVLVFEDQAL